MKLEMIDVLPTAWSPMKTSLYLRSALVEEAAAPADVGGATRLMCTHAFDVQAPHRKAHRIKGKDRELTEIGGRDPLRHRRSRASPV